jgi:hypothetical protein
MDERRKHNRINLRKQCLINHSGNVGEIIDISLGGVSCWCVHGHLCTDGSGRKVDIFCKEGRLWARGLPLHVLEAASVSGTFLGDVPVRKCRAIFTDLRDNQIAQLENIIYGHTQTASRPEQG